MLQYSRQHNEIKATCCEDSRQDAYQLLLPLQCRLRFSSKNSLVKSQWQFISVVYTHKMAWGSNTHEDYKNIFRTEIIAKLNTRHVNFVKIMSVILLHHLFR